MVWFGEQRGTGKKCGDKCVDMIYKRNLMKKKHFLLDNSSFTHNFFYLYILDVICQLHISLLVVGNLPISWFNNSKMKDEPQSNRHTRIICWPLIESQIYEDVYRAASLNLAENHCLCLYSLGALPPPVSTSTRKPSRALGTAPRTLAPMCSNQEQKSS